jgi:thioredoxin-related protein
MIFYIASFPWMLAMYKQFFSIAALALLCLSNLARGESNQTTEDWAQTAEYARSTQVPILILYTAIDCGYCSRLKQEVLQPLFTSGDPDQPVAVLREIDINAGGKMTDFDGEPIRSRQFKQRYQVFATPTLLILDDQGKLLSEPIVGYDAKRQYETLIYQLLQEFRS